MCVSTPQMGFPVLNTLGSTDISSQEEDEDSKLSQAELDKIAVRGRHDVGVLALVLCITRVFFPCLERLAMADRPIAALNFQPSSVGALIMWRQPLVPCSPLQHRRLREHARP